MSFCICTIGCGDISSSSHGPAYKKYAEHTPETELVACCDIDESRAAEFQKRFGFKKYYTDWNVMLKQERCDAVCLVVPEHLTCELSCKILEMGFPLLTEKPPGLTAEEIDRMIAAAKKSGAPHQVAFNRRSAPLIRQLKAELERDVSTFPLQHIRYLFSRSGRKDVDFSTTAIHGVDTVRFIAGEDYRTIRFSYQCFPQLGPTIANVHLDCTFDSGITAHISFCAITGAIVERAEIYLEGITYFLQLPLARELPDYPGMLQKIVNGKQECQLSGIGKADGSDIFEASGFYAENVSFFDDIRRERFPVCDLLNARQSVEIMQCIREKNTEYHRPDK